MPHGGVVALQTHEEVDLYPSRVSDRPEVVPRQDPVLHGGDAAPGPLSRAELQTYGRDGFLFREGLFSPAEVASLREACDRALREARGSRAPEVIREPDGDAVRSIFAVHGRDPWRGVAADPRVLGAARQVLGGDVYVHQSRINLKPGFEGKDFYWHSDFETWHVEDGMPRMRAVSFSILLDDNLPYNGSLMLLPGSHLHYVRCVGRTPQEHFKASLRKQEYGVPDRDSLAWLWERCGVAMPTGPAGSLLMFDCNTMHGSGSNITPLPRRNVFLVFNSVENRLCAPFGGTAPRPEFVATRAGASR
jgi:ectoine hydroxylase